MQRAAHTRIAGSDSGFLYIEGETQTSTCTHTVVLAAPAADQVPLDRARLIAHLGQRLDRTPMMRRRLQHVPLRVGHPIFVDDPHFDLEAHVRHAELPAPGGDAEFHDWVAGQTAVRVDVTRALWHVTLLDGLAGGRQALVFAFHHALADGSALLNVISELLDDHAPTQPPIATPAQRAPAPARTRVGLFATTLARQVFVWLSLPLLLVQTKRRFKAVAAQREGAATRVPSMSGDAPRTVLNLSADNERGYARTHLALDDLRRVRRAAGTTLSDVVLTVIAGALREHLIAAGELPEEPLVVSVPVSNEDSAAPPRVSGNRFCNYYAFLPTPEADPRVRLVATAANTAEAKSQLEVQGRNTLISWLDKIPPALGYWGAARMTDAHLDTERSPDFNVLVSNLRAPRDAMRLHGRAVEEMIFSGPVANGAGLNITVVGYDDRLTFALQTNPSAVPDAAALADRLHDALADLVSVYAPRPTPRHSPEGQVV
ncbi:wax ester/triacylglycerol synthase family O-acyltransferase [Nocardioides gilvus]|uniref:wax ester/triacylglycerol synthase family O-acyltransferase n=1 Tax=Nocardioides gilvus TaxID=1735589 RepID=UPI000D74172B|nr:wax ester/triacylglycerol synthase family O-acyltransferase [Nocardioides gilvus]